LTLVAGFVAGLAAFGIGEATSELIPAETVQFDFFGAARQTVSRDTPRVVTRTAALAFGVLGVCLGGSLGIAGGLARRSAPAAAAGGLLGAVLGGLIGAGSTMGLIPFSLQMRSLHPKTDLIIGMLVHGTIWGALGIAAGLAVAVGLGEPRLAVRAAASGFVGAVLGAIAFDLIGAFAFPLANTDSAISRTWATRLIARLLVGVGTAAVVALFLPAPRRAQVAFREPPAPRTIPES
jgi:hypothetical protein